MKGKELSQNYFFIPSPVQAEVALTARCGRREVVFEEERSIPE